MKSKILFSDLDNTLLNKDHSISRKNRNAITEMLEQGHYFVAVTGKPIVVGRRVVRNLGLTMSGCYLIAFNGALIYDCAADRVLVEHTLPLDIVRDIIEEADKEGIYVQTYQRTHILTREHKKELDFYLKNAKMEYKLVPDIFSYLEKEPHKVVAISLDGKKSLLELQQNFKKKNPDWMKRCNCFLSENEYLEFCPQNINKGMGVKYFAEILNIPLENTVSVGDARNDISMIEMTGVGVAVQNAALELKEKADYVTENDHEHGAVAEVIEKYILA